MNESIDEILKKVQPFYERLNSKYSKSYLEGSSWYKGENLLKWWVNCDKIRNYEENRKAIEHIVAVICNDLRNERRETKDE